MHCPSPIARTEAGVRLPRHRHACGYATLVLEGGYAEAGDAGRFHTEPGDVLFHESHQAHLNIFAAHGATLIDFPLLVRPPFPRGRASDPDAIARLAESDRRGAARLLFSSTVENIKRENDWPDLLARDLLARNSFDIADWATKARLRPSSVSRGFRLAYGVSPQRFRLEARARSAIKHIETSSAALAEIAVETGFADQSHMTRTIRQVTGCRPSFFRQAKDKYVQ